MRRLFKGRRFFFSSILFSINVLKATFISEEILHFCFNFDEIIRCKKSETSYCVIHRTVGIRIFYK